MPALTNSRLGDAFYGQWLLLHVPFDHPPTFIDEELLQNTPAAHRYITVAMNCTHPVAVAMRSSNEATKHELMIEGHTKRHNKPVLFKVRAATKT